MNSYMRQTTTTGTSTAAAVPGSVVVPAVEQMHSSFLKDKQAWENAIALYQGPDPLDHWYNYVCWYENHGHGDPENKFRETLERCLTLYEHNEYYKQDVRMMRLWLKYIDMQSNPLHFYQVLYQRGVGRQVAAFYISWAGYYETVHALKEAESVYNLGFQEKAQPFVELHHAYNKFVYTRNAAAAQAQAAAVQQKTVTAVQQQYVAAQHQQMQHIPQQQVQQQQVQPCRQAAAAPAYAPQATHVQQQQQQQQQHHQQLSQHLYTQQQSQHVSYQPAPQQQQQPQQPQQHSHQSTPLHQTLHHSQHHHQPTAHQLHHNLSHVHAHQQQQQQQQQPQQSHTHTHQHNHQSHQQQPAHLHQQQTPGAELIDGGDYMQPVASANYAAEEAQETVMLDQLPEYVAEQVEEEEVNSVAAIQLPRRFAVYCRNNYETWKPALFLEEPADPSRECHYAKQQVYPGDGCEYSPEELRAQKYATRFEAQHQQTAGHVQQLQEQLGGGQLEPVGTAEDEQQQYDIYYSQSQEEQQQQQAYILNGSGDAYNENESEREENSDENGDEAYEQRQHADDDDEEDEDEQEEAGGVAVQQSYSHATATRTLGRVDDLEEQIEASTIRLGQNKTIKIKFKKERSQLGDTVNGSSNYSAYTIENVYQPEIASPTTYEEQTTRRNGHTFHPYLMGRTSTPKTSSKRLKTKLKRASKFPALNHCSSSNSSSAEAAAMPAGGAVSASCASNMQLQLPPSSGNSAYAPASANAIHNAAFNDNANYSFSSAAALENSNCSLTSAVDRLNFRDSTVGGTTGVSHADFSTYQENSYFATQHDTEAKERRLQKALETIERHLAKEAIDPFSSELCRAFLTKLDFPGSEADANDNYKITETPLPKIANTRTLVLPDGVHFNIDKEVGRGSYGSVYKATDANSAAVVALKFQKPPNTWEIYICDQVLKRVRAPSVLPGLMDVSCAIIAPNASLIATEFSPFGSLLDINNKIRQNTSKVMHESLVMHFSAQICNIINHLHRQRIIHADIKPDNFLLMRVPSTELHYPSLRLIDFGCAIDMTLFPDPERTKFRKVIQTDGFTCIEMQERRPWSYETDLFCIAGTVHVMLMGEYMQLQMRAGVWDIKQKLPRYLKKHVWTKFFGGMLNIEPEGQLPDLSELRALFDEEAAKMDSELQKQIRTLSNILYRR